MIMLEVKSAGHGEYIEKKSKFLGDLTSADTEEQALAIIEHTKKKHYDARHVCSAFVLVNDAGERTTRFSDDGEPSGTAGKPILESMEGADIVNAVLTVTRYFGGTLLGTGGLVRAYTASAKAAIEDATLAERIAVFPLAAEFDYTVSEKALYLLRTDEIPVTDIEYGAGVTVRAMVPVEKRAGIEQRLVDLTSGRFTPEWGEQTGYLL